jgi:hypothetical protein
MCAEHGTLFNHSEVIFRSESIYGPWSQFFKPEQRDEMPLSRCNNIMMRHIQVEAETQYDVKTSDKYELIDFTIDGKPISFEKAPVTNETNQNIVYE